MQLPETLYSAAQVRALDAALIAAGTPGIVLMHRAAEAVWQAILRRWETVGVATVMVGRGNNAGDGYLVAALAQRAGWQVLLYAVEPGAALPVDAALARNQVLDAGVPLQVWTADAPLRGVVVDALLGTGLRAGLRPPYEAAVGAINQSGLPVVAVDIPSGLSADTGTVQPIAVRATVTVTFIALKVGLFIGQGPQMSGEVELADLGAAVTEPGVVQRLTAQNLPRLAPRARDLHKGRLGHVLVVGGEHGMGGAPQLSAQMALRAGAGLVSLATREAHVVSALQRCPEVMSVSVASANQLLPVLAQASVLVIGPGLGQGAWARSLLSAAGCCHGAQVWDADALNLLAGGRVAAPANAILTPHPGEAARLLGTTSAQVQADRVGAVSALAQRYNATVVLKGAGTLVAEPGGRVALCDRGHPAMAGAGLGDVLAGLLGALLAQGLAPYEAACLGVWLHASAGQMLGVQGRGLAASDLPAAVRTVLEEQSACLS